MLDESIARLFPTLSTNPEMADVLARCELRLQQMRRGTPPRGPDEITRTLAPVRR